MVKTSVWQVQGPCYLDLFLFEPGKDSSNEIMLIETIIRLGKAKFLTHPVVEIFLKEKWEIIGKIYYIAVFLFASFCISLGGFAFTNYGRFWFYQTEESHEVTKYTWW